MNSMIICAHHGSPGSARDFFHLKILLPEFHFTFKDRVIKNNSNEVLDADNAQLGYSFGSVEAILSAANNPRTKQVILISPHLFIEKNPGFLIKTLLDVDLIAKFIIKNVAGSKIKSMLVKSSHPLSPPKHYQEDAKSYLQVDRLKHSIIEKQNCSIDLRNALKKLEVRKIPINIICGTDDLTSEYELHVAPLEKYSNVKIHKIKNAGHALLWTHTKELEQHIRDFTLNSKKFGYYDGSCKENNVASFLRDHKSKFPTRKILTWVPPEMLAKWDGNINTPLPHQSITVYELDYLVGVLTTEFKNSGIKIGDRVILFLPMSLYMYASMFALQKMGAIPTFLDSWARRDQMGVSCKVALPTAMISSHRAFEYLSSVEEIKNIPIKIVAGEVPEGINYTNKLEVMLKTTVYAEEVAVDKEHTALITFTTGSSGTPKGADRSHRFLAAQHYALNRHLPYNENDKDLPVFPIFSLNNLAAGVETIIPAIDVGAPNPRDGLVLYAQLKSANVTCTTLSPSLFNGLSTYCIENNLKLDFLKRVVTGGAPISRGDVERMKMVATNAEILVLYGSTEVEPMAHIEAIEMLSDPGAVDAEIVEPGVNVGHLDDGLKFKFIKITKDICYVKNELDWIQITVDQKEVGELIVAGEHVCEKYFNNEEAFFRAKIKDHNNIVWHRTGDLGFLDNNKNLWIVGRVHNAINRNGKWFFPVRAEIILKKFDFVNKAAFLGMEDSKLIQKTYAVFTTNENCNDIESYKHEIRRVMEKNNFIVDEIVHTDEIPMDPRHHSKVEYDVLRSKIASK